MLFKVTANVSGSNKVTTTQKSHAPIILLSSFGTSVKCNTWMFVPAPELYICISSVCLLDTCIGKVLDPLGAAISTYLQSSWLTN